jgi:Nitric oxide synthase, oxygenase domain
MFELPPWYVSRVSIKHADAPWLWDMGVKWTAMPLDSGMELCVGGLTYTAVPYSSWCALLAPPDDMLAAANVRPWITESCVLSRGPHPLAKVFYLRLLRFNSKRLVRSYARI